MVGFKNKYIFMEVFLDPDKYLLGEATPVILTQFNLSKAIQDSILINFRRVWSRLLSRILQCEVCEPNHKAMHCKIFKKRSQTSLVGYDVGQKHRKLSKDLKLAPNQ